MATLHLVLDTNYFRGLTREELDRIASLGLPLRVSEVAIAETWAHSVMLYERGERDRRAARGLFFGRVRRVLPYLDQREPVAFVGAYAREILRADLAGTVPAEHDQTCGRSLAFLRRAAHPEFTDERWLNVARDDFAPFLDRADDRWRQFNLPEDVIWDRRYTDPEQRDRDRAAWGAVTHAQQYGAVLDHVVKDLGLTPAELERCDAMVRVLAWRMMNASHPFGRASENDGADNQLLHHVTNGGILVTRDTALLGAIEACGTTHGPWFRNLDEVLQQPLPDCFPWEPAAAAVRDAFVRTSVRPTQIAGAQWIDGG